MKGENNTSTYKPCSKGKVIWYKWHIGITLTVKETKGMDTPSHYMVGTQGPIIVRWAGKAWRANNDPHPTVERPGRQRPSPTRGINQDIKESGHQSRRPPTHKGYNQYIKDARRLQRATRFSQLKQLEGKICSLTQTCRNANREWTLQIERHP